jgi:predicted short-subunit dehydrogenase-like oxidoreductase (DUF2520 family)
MAGSAAADAERVYLVGAGRMGLALGTALLRSGAATRVVYASRSSVRPDSALLDAPGASWAGALGVPPEDTSVVLLAVPDDALPAVAGLLARRPSPAGAAALHLSGALTAAVLEPMHAAGYAVGTLHPLQTVADPEAGVARLRGCAYAVGGEPAALAAARRLVSDLADQVLVVPPMARPGYHAAAVIASNYLVGLLHLAARQLAPVGLDEAAAVRALLPLVRGTLDNVEALGIPDALTGPIARGDADTVRLHLARLSPGDRLLYSALGREVLRVAGRAGLPQDRAEQLAELLSEAP